MFLKHAYYIRTHAAKFDLRPISQRPNIRIIQRMLHQRYDINRNGQTQRDECSTRIFQLLADKPALLKQDQFEFARNTVVHVIGIKHETYEALNTLGRR